jgi:hypothetical protein
MIVMSNILLLIVSMKSPLFTNTKNLLLIATIVIISTIAMPFQTSLDVGYAQTKSSVNQKEDVFKVIVTLFGVEPTAGNMVTFVTINNISTVKTFDASKYYIPIDGTTTTATTSYIKTGGSGDGGLVELHYSFPNATSSIKSGDEFRVCAMVLKDLQMVCETGVNTPALRAENVDMYLDSAKFLKVEDMKGQSVIEEEEEGEEGEEEDIDAVEEAIGIDEETASEETDEESE